MRPFILFIAMISISISGISQIQFAVGPNYNFGNTWIVNPNMFILSDQNAEVTFESQYGVLANIHFTNWLALETGYQIGIQGQNFSMESEGQSQESSVNVEMNSIPFALKWGKGFHFVSGIQYSQVKDAHYNFSDNSKNVKEHYPSDQIFILSGLGGDIPLSRLFRMNIGLRMGYGVKDFKGVDGYGRTFEDLEFFSELYQAGEDISEYPGSEQYLDQFNEYSDILQKFEDFSKTYSVFAQFQIGIMLTPGGVITKK